MVSLSSTAPVVALVPTTDGQGYWLATSNGNVYSFGDALFEGSLRYLNLSGTVVSIAAAPSGSGYWLAGSDGGVFAFGHAPFLGSVPGRR